MTTTSNFGLPIYGNSDVPKWTDTNEAFQDLDSKAADKTGNNSFSGTNTFGGQVTHNADLLMKGGSTVESDDGVITPTAPSSDKTGTDVVQINDSAGNPLYKVRPIQHSNGKVDLDIAGQPAANGGVLTFNGEDIGGKDVYSTDEQVVGKWIDGKPIYEKTYQFSNISTGNYSRPYNITNLGDVISLSGMLYSIPQGGNGEWRVLPIVYGAQSVITDWFGGVIVRPYDSDFLFQVGSNSVGTANKVFLTMRYTKTTD